MTRAITLSILAAGLALSGVAFAETEESVFELDSFSFVSFEDEEVFPIPSGGTLRFRFGEPNPDGSVPFSLAPDGVAIPAIPVGGGKTLTYQLAAPTSGVCTDHPGGGKSLSFTAKVDAKLTTEHGAGSFQYVMTFTTQTASAANAAGTEAVSVDGMALNESARAMQLVGAATSTKGAYPGPGKAVYTVLSGTFDKLP